MRFIRTRNESIGNTKQLSKWVNYDINLQCTIAICVSQSRVQHSIRFFVCILQPSVENFIRQLKTSWRSSAANIIHIAQHTKTPPGAVCLRNGHIIHNAFDPYESNTRKLTHIHGHEQYFMDHPCLVRQHKVGNKLPRTYTNRLGFAARWKKNTDRTHLGAQ